MKYYIDLDQPTHRIVTANVRLVSLGNLEIDNCDETISYERAVLLLGETDEDVRKFSSLFGKGPTAVQFKEEVSDTVTFQCQLPHLQGPRQFVVGALLDSIRSGTARLKVRLLLLTPGEEMSDGWQETLVTVEVSRKKRDIPVELVRLLCEPGQILFVEISRTRVLDDSNDVPSMVKFGGAVVQDEASWEEEAEIRKQGVRR